MTLVCGRGIPDALCCSVKGRGAEAGEAEAGEAEKKVTSVPNLSQEQEGLPGVAQEALVSQ